MELVYPNEKRLFRIALVLAAIFWLLIIVGTVGIVLVYIGLFMLFAIFAQSGFISHIKGNGIRITPEQYPDLHQRLMACCQKVDQQEVPEAFLLRTDFFNALATRFLRRHYIVLFTDVVDALEEQPGALNFYIGHELGHIQRNHIRWGWILAPVLWLPVLGSALRRAEEYTCDRYGNACCETDADAYAALAAIVAGDTRWPDMNVDAYLKQVEDTSGFFMSFNEFTGEYPWLCKRMAWVKALRQGTSPTLPSRSKLAGFLSIFVPSIPGGAFSLLFIIAIIGILAAVALPAYQSYIDKAEQARAEAQAQEQQLLAPASTAANTDSLNFEQATPENLTRVMDEMATLRNQVSQYYQDNQTLPADLTQMGAAESFVYSENGGMPIAVYDNGVLAVTLYSGDVEAYFVNEPRVTSEGSLDWYCYGQDLPETALPEVCR